MLPGRLDRRVPETLSPEKLAAVDRNLRLDEAASQSWLGRLDQTRMLRRSPRLAEVAEVAAFLASNQTAAITGTFVTVTSGTVPRLAGQFRPGRGRRCLLA
jgi:NAD(P)-dependent dehydrogenase (short-subunit alcohol dehydrogenase family)